MRTAWYVAIAVVLLFFLVRSGGVAALGPLAKFLVPLGVVFMIGYKIKKKLLPIKYAFEQMQRQQENRKFGESEGPTIEICPKCGFEKNATGRCKC